MLLLALLFQALLLQVSCAWVQGQPAQALAPNRCFVALGGSDETGVGTLKRPYRTLARAASVMTPGATCYIRGGRYQEGLVLEEFGGTPGKPVTFQPYPGEQVILDGTMAITSRWERHQGQIYKTRLDRDVWQLFLDGETLTAARFPDASWADGSIWNLKASTRHLAPESVLGLTVDERPPATDAAPGPMWDEGAEEGWDRLPDDVNRLSLAESGIDFSGAVAVLHIGSWLSWAQTVEHHRAGSDRFAYSPEFSKSGGMRDAAESILKKEGFFQTKNIRVGQGYYFLEGLQCLDQPGEWYYSPEDRMLYLYAPGGKDPTGLNVRGKVRSFNVEGNSCSHVTFRGLHFFGTTFRFVNSDHVLVEDCRFDYPSYNKLVLGDFRRPEASGFLVGKASRIRNEVERISRSRSCVVRNCAFRRMDGPALDVEGEDHTVENCLFSEVDYTCLGSGAEGTINMFHSRCAVFRRNTLHTTGNSEGIRVGKQGLIEYNHVYNMSLIQHDGSQINVGVLQQKGTILRNNWSHDSVKAALRFDSSSMGSIHTVEYGVQGTMARNVAWRSGPMKVKGDEHVIVGNTGLWGIGQEGATLAVLDNAIMGGINDRTTTRNNLGVLTGHFRYLQPLPGEASHNVQSARVGHAESMLRDPVNLDFRPRAGSPLIDAGVEVPDVTGSFVGEAPDIGAYEYGAGAYWIPGYRSAGASTPVPPHGSRTVKSDANLMWLGGYQADTHDVYFGTEADAVARAKKTSTLFRGNQTSNIFDPGALQPGQHYFWRVDAVRDGQPLILGSTWRFSVGAK